MLTAVLSNFTCCHTHTHTHTTHANRFTALLDFVRDYPSEPVPGR